LPCKKVGDLFQVEMILRDGRRKIWGNLTNMNNALMMHTQLK
jgi:hypothetical protein